MNNIKNDTDSNIAIEVKNFSKTYKGNKNYAVRDVNFTVKKGSFHGFIGANGAGKTTTIKSLIGAYAKYEGNIYVYGSENTTQEAKEILGYIPEEAKFPKTLNTLEYITHMANLSGMKYKDAKKFAKRTLEEIGLKHVQKRNPNSFSSGQKKKVLLSQALVNDPKVIIMDEPAANLDPRARAEFFQTLKTLQKKGVAIFISSHILTELSNYVDAVTIVDGGKIVFTGSTSELQLNNKKGYVITPLDSKDVSELLEIAKTLKLKGTPNEEKTSVEILTDNEQDQFKITNALTAKKIIIKRMSSNEMTLDEAYDHFVKLGSVDTKGEDTKMSKELNTKGSA